jgi:hypothetical protein
MFNPDAKVRIFIPDEILTSTVKTFSNAKDALCSDERAFSPQGRSSRTRPNDPGSVYCLLRRTRLDQTIAGSSLKRRLRMALPSR